MRDGHRGEEEEKRMREEEEIQKEVLRLERENEKERERLAQVSDSEAYSVHWQFLCFFPFHVFLMIKMALLIPCRCGGGLLLLSQPCKRSTRPPGPPLPSASCL